MTLPNYIGSRAEWDAEQERQLRAAFRGDPEGYRRAWERRYPTTVAGAIDELKRRGLSITEDKLGRYCDLGSLARIGKNYVFYADDIDRLAESLAECGKLTGLALRRKNDGISYAEELEGMRHVLHTRRVRAAESIGVTVDELYAAIRVSGVGDPAFDEVDVEAAKAWFADNAQDAQYQQELGLQEVER